MSRSERLAMAVLLLSALALAGCGASAPAPERDNRRIFFFEPDPDWMEDHPEYVGDYGVIHYTDENGDNKPDLTWSGGVTPRIDDGDVRRDFAREVIQMTPRFHPISLINTSWSYTPRAGERALRLREEEE